MNIAVLNQQKKLRINKEKIVKIVRKILTGEKVSRAEVTISFVSRQQIQSLNRRFLKRTYATDVLAFNLSEGVSPLVGDVIVSTDAAIRYARINHVSAQRETVLYVVHGILHLLGYDDHSPKNIAQMRRKEEVVMKKIHPLMTGAVR